MDAGMGVGGTHSYSHPSLVSTEDITWRATRESLTRERYSQHGKIKDVSSSCDVMFCK